MVKTEFTGKDLMTFFKCPVVERIVKNASGEPVLHFGVAVPVRRNGEFLKYTAVSFVGDYFCEENGAYWIERDGGSD